MLDKLHLRARIFLLFALVGVAVPVLLGGGLWLASDRLGEGAAGPLVLFGGGAGFAIVGVIVWAWQRFDTGVAAPIQTLVRDLQTIVHANPEHRVTTEAGPILSQLASAAGEVVEALTHARGEVADEVDRATRTIEAQKGRLEVILRDLYEGVVICNLNHEILLYNQRALAILHLSGELGLGRSLFSIMNRQPFLHALEQLSLRLADRPEGSDAQGLTTPVICASADGRHILEGRVSLILDSEQETATGYVVTFDDVTVKLATLGKRDRLLREAIDGLRGPVANLRAATEMLVSDPDLSPEERGTFEGVLSEECTTLSAQLERLGQEYRDIIASHWPMSDVYSANVLNCVTRRLNEEPEIAAVMTGIPAWLHCDSHTIVELLDYLVHKINAHNGVASFDLEAASGQRRVYFDLIWQGPVVPNSVIESWLDESLGEGDSGFTAREILERHRSELWCEAQGDGRSRLRLPLPPAIDDHTDEGSRGERLASRPEFYDFDLLNRIDVSAHADRPLRDLTYVVFDTETTGLEPSNGDEIISIAGVRIVNRRILTGESFSQMVNPGRDIPKASIKFHGITEEMVRNEPPIGTVLPQFHRYVGDAVLVAHNAAFDMKFLELKQDQCGLRFANPVLDTVLLSAFLHDHTSQHTLDDVAERFGIKIQGRHTALGDAIVTAGAFLRMIDLLEAQGIRTLAEALDSSSQMAEIRRQQARY